MDNSSFLHDHRGGPKSFSVYGAKLHLICATNRVPVSYELTAANVVAEVRLTEELLGGTN